LRDGQYAQGATYLDGYGWYESEPEAEVGESFTLNANAARTWTRSFTVWP